MPPKSPQQVLLSQPKGKSTATTLSSHKVIRRLHCQIVHRHGDRSPITALQDEAYWQQELMAADRLHEIARPTRILTDNVVLRHKANGRGPFGKLTGLGLQQMVDLGVLLRNEFLQGDADTKGMDAEGNMVYPCIGRPLPSSVRVVSTSFERAIQSAQGVLVGLLGPDLPEGSVQIDARHTVRMLPDPQPRETPEQILLEDILAARDHLQELEEKLLPLALRVTAALHPLLAADAHEAVFGAKQLRHASAESIEKEPLAWNQLAEITKCLACRDRLPAAISAKDHHDVVQHAAWRWFESFRHPRLAYLSMHTQIRHMVTQCQTYSRDNVTDAPLILYSAHDSTLIGLLCAFKLDQPVAWPEYGSFLMMELLEVSDVSTNEESEQSTSTTTSNKPELYVRFSLNGELLCNRWNGGLPCDMILLDMLTDKLEKEDEATRGMIEHASEYRFVEV